MLKDKVAIVTGAASGIGLATAEMLAKEGARVVLADINEAQLEAVSAKIGADALAVDLSKREGCRELADYTMKQHGRIDILVNVAGIQNVASVEDFPEERWDFMISLMLTAPFLLTKYAWPSMKQNGWGRIINLNSIHGLVIIVYDTIFDIYFQLDIKFFTSFRQYAYALCPITPWPVERRTSAEMNLPTSGDRKSVV